MSRGSIDSSKESYARLRIKNSPLSSLQQKSSSPPLSSYLPHNSQNPYQKYTKALDVKSYRYIQEMIKVIISTVIIKNPSANLSSICDIISSEAKYIEVTGLAPPVQDPDDEEDDEEDEDDCYEEYDIDFTEESGERDANN